jgi:hypothetical protein
VVIGQAAAAARPIRIRITPERADAPGGRRAQISLDVRNENLSEKRIHQICAWMPARCRFDER